METKQQPPPAPDDYVHDTIQVNTLAMRQHKKDFLWRIQPHIMHILQNKFTKEEHEFSLQAIINCRRRIAAAKEYDAAQHTN